MYLIMLSERINLKVPTGGSHSTRTFSSICSLGVVPQWVFVYCQGQVQALALIYRVWQFLLLGLSQS